MELPLAGNNARRQNWTHDPERDRTSQWQTHPVTPDRFEDFADVINPNRRATHCWCLSHRLRRQGHRGAGHGEPRGGDAAALRAREPAGGRHLPRRHSGRLVQHRTARRDPAAGRAPSSSARSTRSRCGASSASWCAAGTADRASPPTCSRAPSSTRPRAGHPPSRPTRWTRQGRMDTTMAFVGTRAMFEQAGFRVIGTTDAVASRMPRLIMRRDL